MDRWRFSKTGEKFNTIRFASFSGRFRFLVRFVLGYVSFSGSFRFFGMFRFRVRFVFGYAPFLSTFCFRVLFVFGYVSFSVCAPFLVTFCFIFGYVSVTFRLRVRFVMFRLRLRFVFGYVSFSGTFRFRLRFVFGYVSFSGTFRFRLRFVFRYVSFSVTFLLCVFFCYALFSGTKTLLWTLNVWCFFREYIYKRNLSKNYISLVSGVSFMLGIFAWIIGFRSLPLSGLLLFCPFDACFYFQIKTLCLDKEPGHGEVMECLKDNYKRIPIGQCKQVCSMWHTLW